MNTFTIRRKLRYVLLAIATLLLTSFPSITSAQEENEQLLNGDFASGELDPWWTNSPVDFNIVDEEFCVDILDDPSSDPWAYMLGHDAVNLIAGETYVYSFDAYATVPVDIVSVTQFNGPPYTAYARINAEVTTEVQRFEDTFTMAVDDDSAQTNFQFGASSDASLLCIDNISLVGGAPRPTFEIDTGSPVRTNQHGYVTDGPKLASAVYTSTTPLEWTLVDDSGATVDSGMTTVHGFDVMAGDDVHKIDFTSFETEGMGYKLIVGTDESHPFDINITLYNQLAIDSLHYFYHNRSAIDILEQYVGVDYAREAGHTADTVSSDAAVTCGGLLVDLSDVYSCDYSLDVTKGWYDAGDHGKYVVNGGISVWKLLNSYERSQFVDGANREAFADGSMPIPENGNDIADILDETRWELEFLMKMQVPEGEVLAGMAHHKVHDTVWAGLPMLPVDATLTRILRPPSTAATLNLAAAAGQCARIWETIDPAFSAQCLTSAEIAWDAAIANPEQYILSTDNDGNGGGAYNDSNVTDEFYWAAAELYITTGKQVYLDYLQASPYHDGSSVEDEFYWGETAPLGNLSLVLVENDLPMTELAIMETAITDAAEGLLADIENQGYPVPYLPGSNYSWGSNAGVMNNMITLGAAYDISGDMKYADGVFNGMNYLLGQNALNISYITGYGDNYVMNQHHRHWANQKNDALPIPPPGTVAGGPNSNLQDPFVLVQIPDCVAAPQKCFIDHIDSYSTNEVTVNWNSALVWTSAFIVDVTNDGMAIVPTPTPVPPTATPAPQQTTVNCDSVWNLVDVILIKRYDVFIISATSDCMVASGNRAFYLSECDRNNDGQCSLVDAVIVQQCNALVTNPYCGDL